MRKQLFLLFFLLIMMPFAFASAPWASKFGSQQYLDYNISYCLNGTRALVDYLFMNYSGQTYPKTVCLYAFENNTVSGTQNVQLMYNTSGIPLGTELLAGSYFYNGTLTTNYMTIFQTGTFDGGSTYEWSSPRIRIYSSNDGGSTWTLRIDQNTTPSCGSPGVIASYSRTWSYESFDYNALNITFTPKICGSGWVTEAVWAVNISNVATNNLPYINGINPSDGLVGEKLNGGINVTDAENDTIYYAYDCDSQESAGQDHVQKIEASLQPSTLWDFFDNVPTGSFQCSLGARVNKGLAGTYIAQACPSLEPFLTENYGTLLGGKHYFTISLKSNNSNYSYTSWAYQKLIGVFTGSWDTNMTDRVIWNLDKSENPRVNSFTTDTNHPTFMMTYLNDEDFVQHAFLFNRSGSVMVLKELFFDNGTRTIGYVNVSPTKLFIRYFITLNKVNASFQYDYWDAVNNSIGVSWNSHSYYNDSSITTSNVTNNIEFVTLDNVKSLNLMAFTQDDVILDYKNFVADPTFSCTYADSGDYIFRAWATDTTHFNVTSVYRDFIVSIRQSFGSKDYVFTNWDIDLSYKDFSKMWLSLGLLMIFVVGTVLYYIVNKLSYESVSGLSPYIFMLAVGAFILSIMKLLDSWLMVVSCVVLSLFISKAISEHIGNVSFTGYMFVVSVGIYFAIFYALIALLGISTGAIDWQPIGINADYFTQSSGSVVSSIVSFLRGSAGLASNIIDNLGKILFLDIINLSAWFKFILVTIHGLIAGGAVIYAFVQVRGSQL